jgi:NAD(P)-dependent dehydrogenase (short-subunit alcohol dehydrogenase family)
MAITIDHAGKVALVTGAGAGIGREVARWLARAGAAVAVCDVRAEPAAAVVAEIEAEGGVAVALVADCRDDAQVDAMVRATVERFGGLDFAVNNVGMLPHGRTVKPFVEYRGDDWRDIVDQNLTLAALSARAEAEVMLERGRGGVIVFVSSGETTRPSPLNSIYAAAKAAINHLVTSMAVELGPAGIRVLAVAPGTTLTETVRAAFTDGHVDAIVESTALRRMVEHDELARLCVFLTSDLARCVTGQLILADAGAFLSRTRPRNLRHDETRLPPTATPDPIEEEPA